MAVGGGGATAVLAMASVAFAILWLWPAPLPTVTRFEIYAPPDSTLAAGNPAVSPDGRMLAYTVDDPDGETRIHLRPIDRVESRPLPGTEGAMHPFWSPDGGSLGYASFELASGGHLYRIDVAGGAPRELATTIGPWHGTWNQHGDILFAGGRVSADGGPVAPWPGRSGYPAFLLDGERFLVAASVGEEPAIQLGRLGSTERSVVLRDVSGAGIPAPAPNGKTYLLFLGESDLMAQEFDETSGSVVGDAVVLVPDVLKLARQADLPAVGVSPSGILAYQVGTASADPGRLVWFDRAGRELGGLQPDVAIDRPELSPDGSLVAGTRDDASGNRDIWVTDLARGSSSRVTFDDQNTEGSPVWSPDGTRLAFRHVGTGIHITDLAGADDDLLVTPVDAFVSSWSPDGRYLLYNTSGTMTLQPVAGDEDPTDVGSRNGRSLEGQFSPDGNYIAFTSDESGRREVYVRPLPPATGQVKVSINGGESPRWRSDGTELFFMSEDNVIMAVDVDTGETLSVGVPQELFRAGYRRFDVHPDGERFLVLMPLDNAQDRTIAVVQNWWVELEERVSPD